MDLFYKAVVFLYVLSIQTPAKNQLGCSCILDGSTFFLCSSRSHIFSILLLREIAMGSALLISALPLSATKSFSFFTINFEEIVLTVHMFLQTLFYAATELPRIGIDTYKLKQLDKIFTLFGRLIRLSAASPRRVFN
jgi:hypothetical protein